MRHLLHFLILFCAFSLYASENIITTSSGKVSPQNKNGVLFFEDIPYAQPPVGFLRWKAPREIKSNEIIIKPKKDNFCVLLRREGQSQLIYKHAISTIMPSQEISLYNGED